MNLLFISNNGSSLGLAERVKKEGHNAFFYILEEQARKAGDGIVDKPITSSLVMKDNGYPIATNINTLLKETDPDVVIFDMVHLGRVADMIREKSIPVLGASFWADNAELDRVYSQKLMTTVGITTPPTKNFKPGQYEEAIRFVEGSGKRYVYKPSGNIDTAHTYVSQGPSDMASMLKLWKTDKCEFQLQEYVEGIEVSCELWWNGLHPLIHNVTFEEKKFMNDDIGPSTGCSGNIVHIIPSDCKLVKEGVGKMIRLLKKTEYRGPIDLNSIVTKDKLYGLEFTMRFGYDALQALLEIYKGSITQLLHSIAVGSRDFGEFTSDCGIAVRLSIPPYPHTDSPKEVLKGVPILGVTPANEKHIWWGDARKGEEHFESAGVGGDVLTVVARGRHVDECIRRVYRTANNLVIPQVQYRTDIGKRVVADEKQLIRWGYL